MFFSVLECKKRKSRSHGKLKNGNIMRKICTEKRLNTSLMLSLHQRRFDGALKRRAKRHQSVTKLD